MSSVSSKVIATAVLFPLSAILPHTPAVAQDNQVLEEIITVGTRGKPRSVTDSPVPVDVITGDDFNANGGTADITDNLKALVPSYTATPATGDGSAFVRPTSLRGMAPDQSLVLINGKRRHRSALVQFFAPAAGNGAHGPDIAMIPAIALQRVEVLRDGAAAQYGSDAISGVINFVPKDDAEGGEVHLQYGKHYEGEQNYKLAANVGIPLGSDGFINLSVEHNDNDALSRGNQRPDAQALVDAGVPGVGADAPFGDEPLVQTWGRPETKGTRFFLNSGIDLANGSQLYLFGNYADTDGRYRFFYRPPDHPTLNSLRELGFNGLPAGYTPFLDGAQKDVSGVLGLNGEFSGGMAYDFSVGYGKNELDYFLNNTTNPSLPLVNGAPKRDFDVGGYEQKEVNLNADFSKAIRDNVNLAFGAEWREETYVAIQGEPDSFFGAGSNGFGGIKPRDAGSFSRDNWAVYADVEHDLNDRFLMQYALRYEDFSDFGDTINGKLAMRFDVSDSTTLRGAVSTGFHAPTPGQSNVRTTITTFDGRTGQQVEEGLVPSTSPLVALVGGAPLKEEESVSVSAGFTTDIGDNTTLTVDGYRIEVDDRIYRTGDIQIPGTVDATLSFYTNALDVRSQGVDVVVTSAIDWSAGASTSISFAFNYNDVKVTGQKQVNGVNPVSDAIVEDIENNYPNERFVLTANTQFNDRINFMARANFYGSHYDERGRINAAIDPSKKIGATIYFDAELGYSFTDNFKLLVGATNIFDQFVDTIDPPFANRNSVGLPYPRRSAANYEGGSWYLKTIFNF